MNPLQPPGTTAGDSRGLSGFAGVQVQEYSRYAARVMATGKVPAEIWQSSAHTPWTRDRLRQRLDLIRQSISLVDPERALMAALRRLRAEVLVGIMTRDLNGQASLSEVTESMTLLAEVTLQAGVEWLRETLCQRHGIPRGSDSGLEQELLVVGMGKLGGRELNVSSDIDLIFVYEEDGETDGSGVGTALSNHQFFWRMGQKLGALLSEITEDGFVFRVDLRLRPNGTAGPVAVSLAMLEEYFVVQGRDWERYAWIKARVVSDAARPGVSRGMAALAQLVTPFVYRRHLDYSAIGSLRTIHRQIREEADRESVRQAAWRGENIKLGRGGIREIEFVVQAFQLIRGGQDALLRLIPTLEVLSVLAQRGFLPMDTVILLRDHYIFLRQLEHRLQYLDDAQTHSLPMDNDDQARVAGAMGFVDFEAFRSNLVPRLQFVSGVFDRIFPAESVSSPAGPGERLWAQAGNEAFSEQGDDVDGDLLQKLVAMRQFPAYRAQSARTREQFDRAFGRGLNQILEGYDHPQRAVVLTRFLHFMEAISRRASYLMLLVDYPVVLERLLSLLAVSEWAARYVTQRPQLLDEFLVDADPQRTDFDQYWTHFRATLRARLLEVSGDTEEHMDILRRARHAETFRILLRDLRGELTVEEVADRLSALADVMMALVLEASWQEVPERHHEMPRFAVIAYGKWGSKEMGYASDLDLVFLYQDDHQEAQDNYSLLARKILRWMTTPTGVGVLYEVDLQLRPNGGAGLLVSPLEAFRHYQLQDRDNSAWVWEHQALTRARYAAGDSVIGAAFEAIRHQVLTRVRDLQALRAEILHMRQRLHKGHRNITELFDVKQDEGGVVDVEFLVQYLILAYAHRQPELVDNVGNA
ncbi:MAG: bifunctional [glutamate--ammonia ligase]-adenylyl-L-tyrosine phosphorylase/[glutamate--ammonia-ligase] adenylyltransferase, partial [Ferrovum sp.]|nr:bifunctional [glutamate--ammonia ligase]-adenylyl-L-tyrosine phosphorylase/[glutamate--ammonia-ligase] adenylyltransferase [Ferrovum sp.]